ncbi:MAG: alpha/beta fold hydrolase, partial [Burkholderiales bacterium]
MKPEKQSIALPSGTLDYWVAGEGTPVVHCHPAGGVRWGGVQKALATKFKLYTPIVPGFDGTADHADIETIRDVAGLIARFIDRAIGKPVDLIGHSFGGWVAAWLA